MENAQIARMLKLFVHSLCLSALHNYFVLYYTNYFDVPTKLFSDLYLAKFLDT